MEQELIDRGLNLLGSSLKPLPHELNNLDWKVDISSKGTRLAQHISAFANYSHGAFFVFGVDVDGNIIGITTDKVTNILQKITNTARDAIEPKVSIDHAIVEYNGKNILLVYIPETYPKPVQLKGKGMEYSYVRTGGQTRQMSREEIAKCILSSNYPKYEKEPATAAIPWDEALSLLDYKEYFNILGQQIPGSTAKIIDELAKYKFIEISGQKVIITNLGVVSIAHDMGNFAKHARRAIRLIFYKGTNRAKAEQEILYKQGYAVGFKKLIDYLVEKLPSNEVIGGALRQDVPLYPELTLREIIANSIIHQDFFVDAINPKIEVFSDRIEINNPGNSVVPLDRIIDTEEPRNELLARTMHKLGICEDRGSGVDKALNAIEYYGLPPLKFEQSTTVFKVTIYAPKEYKDMSQEERVRACFQHCVLKFISNEKMTNATLRERLKISEKNYPMVSRIIKDAIGAGKIKIANPEASSTKFVYYVPAWA